MLRMQDERHGQRIAHDQAGERGDQDAQSQAVGPVVMGAQEDQRQADEHQQIAQRVGQAHPPRKRREPALLEEGREQERPGEGRCRPQEEQAIQEREQPRARQRRAGNEEDR